MEDRIEVVHTPSALLMADGLTKALQGPKFKEFISQLGMVDIQERLERRRREEKDYSQEDLEARIQEALDIADGNGPDLTGIAS